MASSLLLKAGNEYTLKLVGEAGPLLIGNLAVYFDRAARVQGIELISPHFSGEDKTVRFSSIQDITPKNIIEMMNKAAEDFQSVNGGNEVFLAIVKDDNPNRKVSSSTNALFSILKEEIQRPFPERKLTAGERTIQKN